MMPNLPSVASEAVVMTTPGDASKTFGIVTTLGFSAHSDPNDMGFILQTTVATTNALNESKVSLVCFHSLFKSRPP